jgi:Flp pilus assembly protein TadG
MVEMAIVLPILLMLFFAIAEFSIAFLRWQTVTTAAREGAREASLFRPNCASSVGAAVDQTVNNVLSTSGIASGSVTLAGACVSAGSAVVTVSVPYRFQILPGFVDTLGSNPFNLTATSVMRNEFAGAGGGS